MRNKPLKPRQAPQRKPTIRRRDERRSEMFRDVVTLFYATTGRLRSLKRLVSASVRLNSADYSIVAALYRLNSESGVRVKEVAEYLHLAPENITTAVQRLVSKKWITKASIPSDGRAVTLHLSATAKKRMDRLTDDLREINELWFERMSTKEIYSLTKYLEAVLDGFDSAHELAKRKLIPKSRDADVD